MNETTIILIVIGLIIFLSAVVFIFRLRTKGKGGQTSEQTGSLQLEEKLDRDKYKTIPKISLPLDNGAVDVVGPVIVAPYGIFIIDRIPYGGDIQGSNEAQTWVSSKRRKKNEFPNPLSKNYQYIRILEDKLAVDFSKFRSVIVFNDKSNFVAGAPPNVITENSLIEYIQSYSYQILQDLEVRDIEKKLRTSAIFNTFATSPAPETEFRPAKTTKTKETDTPARVASKAGAKKKSSDLPLGQRILKSPFTKAAFAVALIAAMVFLFPLLYNEYLKKTQPGTSHSSSSPSTGLAQEEKSTGIPNILDFFKPQDRAGDAKQRANQVAEESNKATHRLNDLDGYLFTPEGVRTTSPQRNQAGQRSPQGMPGQLSGGEPPSNSTRKSPQAFYSWTNQKGQRVVSTKGFPPDGKYTDPKIEWK